MRTETSKPWNWLLFPFSSIKAGLNGIYAAAVGHGVYRIDSDDEWMKLEAGLPDSVSVNRLQLQHELLHACSNSGLYEWVDDEWVNDGLTIPCYQYRKIGGTSFAATEYGLWTRSGADWEQSALGGKRLLDFMNLPQFLVVATDTGISLYDRFMDDWAHFDLGTMVTSISVYQGRLIGATDSGELIVGDKRGGFVRIGFGGNPFIFNVMSQGGIVYAGTDKGLFRMSSLKGQVMLAAVKLGCPVTDVVLQDESLYMATLFHGIQSMNLSYFYKK